MATLDTTLPSVAFPHEVDALDITASTATKVELRYNGKTIFSSSLFPVDGRIELRDITSLIDSYLVAEVNTFEVYLDGSKADYTSLIPCRLWVDGHAEDLDGFFLTRATEKYTHPGATEKLVLYANNPTVYITAIGQHKETGDVVTDELTRTISSNGLATLDLSSMLQNTSNSYNILRYIVRMGKSMVTYHMIPDGMADNVHDFGFINSFNQEEYITLMGAAVREMKIERRSAIIGGQYRNFGVDAVPHWTIESGMMLDGMQGLFDDLISATKVWRVGDNVQMAVTDSDFKVSDDNATALQGSVTLREEGRKYRHNVAQQARTFDITFDTTFL